MKKGLLFIIVAMASWCQLNAQNFEQNFEDKTLRLDYIFSGNANEQHISVDQLNVSPRWYGKRIRLAEVPMEGNGQVTMRRHSTGEVIYRNSFSTLFQEWITNPEAQDITKAFENVFLVPMPRDTVDVTVELRNNRRQVTAALTHTVVPTDILIRRIGEHDVTPFCYVQQADDTTRCIKIAYVAEGYQKDEMQVFLNDVDVAHEAMFEHEPFKSMRDRFTVVAVMSESKESGTSEPNKGIWKNTVLHSHFNTFYMDRYLTTLHLKDLHDVLAGIPYEHIIVLVNTDRYGGGGILNSYNLTSTHHKKYRPVVVHEFGHSFAGLADEYAYDNENLDMYPTDVEPWEPNITTRVDFHGKWENLIKKGTPLPTPLSEDPKTIQTRVGLFEGAGYQMTGAYRGVQDCRMRTNENPEFCPVCKQAVQRVIDFYTKE